MRRARHAAEYLPVLAASWLIAPLPMARVRRIGEAIGRFACRFAGSRRRVAMRNLAHAFPAMGVEEREAIVRGMFAHFGRVIFELLRAGTLPDDEMPSLFDTEGGEHVVRAYEAGKGLILISGHFGYWEIQGLAHARCWKPISVMARPLDNPHLHAMLEGIRTRNGNTVIYRQGSMRKVLRALGANRGVAILIDQHLQTPDAIHVNFFGRPAATTSVVGALARRTGATVIPAFGVPIEGGRYRFVYERPVEPPADDSPEAIHDFTQRCTDAIETYVRRHPDLWLWMHRRWRDLPADQADTRAAEMGGGMVAGDRDV